MNGLAEGYLVVLGDAEKLAAAVIPDDLAGDGVELPDAHACGGHGEAQPGCVITEPGMGSGKIMNGYWFHRKELSNIFLWNRCIVEDNTKE